MLGRFGGLAIGAALACGAILAPGAAAHEDPPGCNASGLNFQFDPTIPDGLFIIHRNGDHLSLGVRIRNDAPGACSYDDATVTVRFPAPDGSPTGPLVTVASDASFPGGMAQQTLPTRAEHVVDFDPGVFSAPVTISVSGTGHFPGGDITGPIGSSGQNLVVSKPHITLGVTPSAPSGPAPFGVTYTYTATNDSPDDPGQPANTPDLFSPTGDRSIISDDRCSPVTYVSGDTDMTSPPKLDDGETWTLTCTRVFDFPGAFTNTARIIGTSSRDGRDWPNTTAQSTVTANGADMTVSKTHEGDFVAGDSGRTYTLTARNSGNQPTSGAVTLQDSLPAGLTATAITGQGWACDLGSLTCTRSDPLAGGTSYPPVTVTVDIASDAPEQVTNVASVSGGNEVPTGNNSASDPTAIARAPGGDGGGEPEPEPEPEDRDPPNGEIRKVKVKGDDVKVTFRSDEPGSTFECRLDKKRFKPCTSPKIFRNVKDGKHKFFVRATDAAGNVDASAAKRKFRIED